MPRQIILRMFPPTDAALARAAERSLATASVNATDDELAEAMRLALVSAGYPAADVRRRERIADVTSGTEPMIYVYRDGRVRPPDPRTDRR